MVVPAIGDPSTEVLERVDGLVLTGGGDVDPALYGAVAAPETAGVDVVRDRHEIVLARAAVERGLPVLAICRGQQVLNVALGGTLRQHIEGHAGTHDHPVENGITVDVGTRLGEACGVGVVAACSCRHHQAIDDVAPVLRIVARAADGTIEAVEHDGAAWIVGVQWHPETTAAKAVHQQAIFDAFVAAASLGS